jgi:hypothetical protein
MAKEIEGTPPIPESLYEILSDFALRRKEIAAIYIFGSTAAKKHRSGSDVDIAIMVQVTVDGMERMRWETLLSNLLKRDADVIIFNDATPLLQHQILKYGHLVFERNPRERIRQEVVARREYLDSLDLYRVIEG